MKEQSNTRDQASDQQDGKQQQPTDKDRPKELGGRKSGREPTRYGDWEKNGRCIDF